MYGASIWIDVPNEGACRGGDRVPVTVWVWCHQPLACRTVMLEHFWRVDGEGASDVEVLSQQDHHIEAGGLPAGQYMSFSFQVDIPPYPVSYRGHAINLAHYLKVSLVVPRGHDITSGCQLAVYPGAPIENEADDELGGRAGHRTHEPGRGSLWAGGLTVAAGVALFFYGLHEESPAAGLMGIGAGLIGVVMFFVGLHVRLTRVLLGGRVDIIPVSWHVHPGAGMPVRVRFVPVVPLRLNAVTLRLKGHKTFHSGGEDHYPREDEIHASDENLATKRWVSRNEAVEFETDISIPEDAPPSFEVEHNSVNWTLSLEICPWFLRTWLESRLVVVRPWQIPELTADAGRAPGAARLG